MAVDFDFDETPDEETATANEVELEEEPVKRNHARPVTGFLP